MDTANLISFTLFAFTAAFTPGPNNIMLAASGANFGLRRTLPHIFGIFVGFMGMVIAANYGLIAVFAQFPELILIIRTAGLIFIAYLAYAIATSAAPEHAPLSKKPFSFFTAMSFQLINPKAVIVVASAISAYAADAADPQTASVIIISLFAFVTLTSTVLWGYAGMQLGRLLQNATHLRLFNVMMAALLVISLVPVLLDISVSDLQLPLTE